MPMLVRKPMPSLPVTVTELGCCRAVSSLVFSSEISFSSFTMILSNFALSVASASFFCLRALSRAACSREISVACRSALEVSLRPWAGSSLSLS